MVVEDLALLKEQVRAAVSFRFNLFWGFGVVRFAEVDGQDFCFGMDFVWFGNGKS